VSVKDLEVVSESKGVIPVLYYDEQTGEEEDPVVIVKLSKN
jgi:hypothetical protein